MRQSELVYNTSKTEGTVLALLGVPEFGNGRVWKRYDFDVMASLHSKGLITAPNGRAESVHLTEAGMLRAKGLADRLFGGASWVCPCVFFDRPLTGAEDRGMNMGTGSITASRQHGGAAFAWQQ